MKRITSIHNPRIKSAIKLRSRRGRKQQARFLVDGFREVERFLAAGLDASELFVCEELVEAEQLERLDQSANCRSLDVYSLPIDLYQKIAYGDRSDGVIASGVVVKRTIDSIPLPTNPLVCILESIEKPGNLGAIIRTAEACGVSAVIHVGQGTDWFHPNAIRSSTGAVFSMACAEASFDETMTWLQRHDIRPLAAFPDAQLDYASLDMNVSTAIVLGREATGLSKEWNDDRVTSIQIPMQGLVDSLNVSVTAAVLLFEAQRQRRTPR